MDDAPAFPPLFRGEAVARNQDPFARAMSQAMRGIDPGLITYRIDDGHLRAALVLAPETALEDAMAMVFAAALGFSDALGALAPPEVAVHMVWPGGFRVNGARCGTLRAAASTDDPAAVPDWLVLGLTVPFLPPDGVEPGAAPDDTALYLEGCGDVSAVLLLESWSRHTLGWINTWEDEGFSRLHTDWRGRAFGIGKSTDGGTFVGLDEQGGKLVRNGNDTTLVPLSSMLEKI